MHTKFLECQTAAPTKAKCVNCDLVTVDEKTYSCTRMWHAIKIVCTRVKNLLCQNIFCKSNVRLQSFALYINVKRKMSCVSWVLLLYDNRTLLLLHVFTICIIFIILTYTKNIGKSSVQSTYQAYKKKKINKI